MTTEVQVHPLLTTDALRGVERLQRVVWGYADNEVVPAPQMRAALHAGALVAGAFIGRELVGFVYGFPALPHEPGLDGPGLHSHMAAVLPEARGLGVGRQLKWFQRRWCLDRGLNWCAWTFDPLQSGNARLNLHHLGAVVREFQVDFYGVLGGALSGELPTDRYVALWELRSDRVRDRAARDPAAAVYRVEGDGPGAGPVTEMGPAPAWALGRSGDADAPLPPRLGVDAPVLWQAAPRDILRLRRESLQVALDWAEGIRQTANDLVGRGYQVDAFVDSAYRWRLQEGDQVAAPREIRE